MPHDSRARAWPLFRSLASYSLPGDLMAGLTLAAIAIPEQMATARLGGFAPQIGFFAFMAGSLGFAPLGGEPVPSLGARFPLTPLFPRGRGGPAPGRPPPNLGPSVPAPPMGGAVL